MRILIALAATLSIALAGCGREQGNGQNAQNGVGLSTPGARPGGNSAELASDATFREGYRRLNIQTCITSAQSRAAQGGDARNVDFRPACTCYIDRAMAGLSVEQLTRLQPGAREEAILTQCAREHGLLPNEEAGAR